MHRISSCFLVAILGWVVASAAGQDSRPTSGPSTSAESKPVDRELRQDPKALEEIDKMAARLYRPRDAGLKDLKCKVALSQVRDGKTEETISFTYEWTPLKDRISSPSSQAAFPADILVELIGPDTVKILTQFHIARRADGAIEFTTPQWVKPRPIDHMIMLVDDQGRPKTQEYYDRPDHVMRTTSLTYRALGEKWLIVGREHKTPGGSLATTYEHKEIDGMTLMSKVQMKTAGGEVVITISDHEVNKGLVLK